MTSQTQRWLDSTLKMLGCSSVKDLTHSKCKAPVKEELASTLHGALVHISKLIDEVRRLTEESAELQEKLEESMETSVHLSQASGETLVLQQKLLDSQETVVQLQKQLLDSKEEQLRAVTTSVKTSVQETVKEEFKTYSSVVKSGQQQMTPVTPTNIVSVVKKVVEEEDRSRNIMVFGLVEGESEDLAKKVGDVMEKIGEKPRIEVCRVGKAKDGKPRPVKITLSSSLNVSQILSKSRRLGETAQYKTVFLSPDRSYEQRAEHRTLVVDLKRRKTAEPNKRHFIRNGTVNTVEKTAAQL